MRKLTFGMNLSLDGYIAAPGDDLGWSVPSDELFQWWSDRVGATGLALYGRKLWETMSSHWPTADKQPGATPAQIEFAGRWRDMPKVVFSSTTSTVDWNTPSGNRRTSGRPRISWLCSEAIVTSLPVPVQRQNEGARELPIGWRSSTIAVALRQRRCSPRRSSDHRSAWIVGT